MIRSDLGREVLPPRSGPVLLGFILALAVIGTLFALDFPWPQAAVSGLLIIAITLWSGSFVAPPVAALVIMALIPAMGIAPYESAIGGFGSSLVWLFLAVSILAIALRKVGLVDYAANWIVRMGGGNASRTMLAFMVVSVIMSVAVPTNVARAGLLVMLVGGVIRAFGRESPGLAKAFGLAGAMSIFATQMIVVTGTNGALYAVAFFETHGPYTINFSYWLALNAPIGLIQAWTVWWVLRRQYQLHRIEAEVPPSAKGVRLTPAQARVLSIFGLLLFVWIAGPWVGIPMHPATLLLCSILLVPGIGVLSWDEVKGNIPWGTAMLLASAIAVGEGFRKTGMGDMLAGLLTDWLTGTPGWMAVVTVTLAFMLLRVAFVNLLSLLVTFLPIVVAVGAAMGIDPVWLTMIGVYTGSYGFFVPAQSPVSLTMASTGELDLGDLSRLGILLAPVWVSVLLIVAYTWWPFLGLNPFQ